MPQHARRRLTRRDVTRRTVVGGLGLAGGAVIAGPLVAGAESNKTVGAPNAWKSGLSERLFRLLLLTPAGVVQAVRWSSA
ncbi:hypothetical protein ACIP4U_13800 [Streptomyces caelestis]|uniref:hypothetical protein n=1 Tax=Streptomyces caelestis TaxID=36816 RepID=UPI00381952F4